MLKRGQVLVFEGGTLTVNESGYGNRDGAGCLSFREDDLEWDADPASAATRYVNLPKSEIIAIRDFLNKMFPA